MIEESTILNYLPLVGSWLQGKPQPNIKDNPKNPDFRIAAFQLGKYEISEYGEEIAPEYAPENSVAIINISDTITKHDQDCGPSGMLTKGEILTRCFSNDKIKGVILNVDSGGGEGRACRLLQDVISSRNKPVVGFIDDFACSAAYGIVSACDLIVANNEVARIGSIGSYFTIADYAKYYEQLGIKLIEVYATRSKDKNQEYHQAVSGDPEPLRKICDVYNEDFISRIASFRSGKISPDQNLWATGKTFFTPEALDLGLIDRVDSLENVINYFNT